MHRSQDSLAGYKHLFICCPHIARLGLHSAATSTLEICSQMAAKLSRHFQISNFGLKNASYFSESSQVVVKHSIESTLLYSCQADAPKRHEVKVARR